MPLHPDIEYAQDIPRPIAATATDYPPGHKIDWHIHRRAQLIHDLDGVISVNTEVGKWVIPPELAVWVPAGIEHRVETVGRVRLRSLFIAADATRGMPEECCVVSVSPLLKALIIEAVELPKLYEPEGPDGRVMAVIMDQLRTLNPTPLSLPIPTDPRLRRVTDVLIDNPANQDGLEKWAETAGASARTLARLFIKDTSLTFGAWRQQARLLKALEWLSQGKSVTAIALDLGYESPSAFIAMFRRAMGMPPGRYIKKSQPPSPRRTPASAR